MTENTPTAQPLTNLYICPQCGRWQAHSFLIEALAQLAGPIVRICNEDETPLIKIAPDARLAVREEWKPQLV